jgi:hypothetical protein
VISLVVNRLKDTWDNLPKLTLREFTNLKAVEIRNSPTLAGTFDYFLGVQAVDLLVDADRRPKQGIARTLVGSMQTCKHLPRLQRSERLVYAQRDKRIQ